MPRNPITPTTPWNSPRYSLNIEDINWNNLEDINGVPLQWISWNRVNNIDTVINNPRVTWQALWTEDILPWQEDFFPWLYWNVISTEFNTPRYSTFIEDINGNNLEDINWVPLEWISWNRVNKIDTVYT